MPGPGQGKHSQKKKQRENAFNLNANIASVNAVMNTETLTVRTDPFANETAPQTTTTANTATSTADTAPISTPCNGNDATCINTAASSPVDPAPDTSSFTYSHEEVQQLLESARLDGWEEGYEEGSKKLMEGYRDGYEAGKKLGLENEEMARGNGLLEGHKLGMRGALPLYGGPCACTTPRSHFNRGC
jgi:hypothetical protein